VPNVTEELRMLLWLVSITFRMAMSPMMGAEMVAMRRRTADAKRRKVPKWWKMPVFAIAMVLLIIRRLEEFDAVLR